MQYNICASQFLVMTALSVLQPLGAAHAATATTTTAIAATVQATCLVTAGSMAFGIYTGVQTDSTATISITCTNTTLYTVGLSAGLGVTPTATATTRHMTGPAAANLNYGLYSDAARATNWGFTPATDTVGGTGNGSVQPLTVYGRIPVAQFVAPGAYTDIVTATVAY